MTVEPDHDTTAATSLTLLAVGATIFRMIYRRSIAFATLGLVLALGGCGTSGANATPRPSGPVPAGRCGPPAASFTGLRIASTEGAVLDAEELGSGPRGIVLVPELGARNLCGWWAYGVDLARSGYHVLLFDHRCAGHSTCPTTRDPNGQLSDIASVTGQLRQDGATRIVLIGASRGGAEVVIAGARPPVGVVGIVALSADELTDQLAVAPYPSSARVAASSVAVPSLFAVTTDDPYVSVVDTRQLVASVTGTDKRLIELPPGRGHGWDLLTPGPDGTWPPPDPELRAFLGAQLPPTTPTACAGEPVARPLTTQAGPAEVIGNGRVAVIAANQSDEDRCSWLSLVPTLVGRGFRVVLWDYHGGEPPAELAAVTRAAHADGASRVVLLGASKGAKTALVAARRMNAPYLSGVISLSAEANLSPDIDVAAACAGLAVPVLLVTATKDPYGSADALGAIRRGLPHAQVLTVPGQDHGTALLPDAGVTPAILSFLAQAVSGSS